jgi:hypothetical protein
MRREGNETMAQIDLKRVELVGGGLSQDGERFALIFMSKEGERLALGIDVRQFPELVRAAAETQSQARKLYGDQVLPIAVNTWSTAETPDVAILSLKVFGGSELRFKLSRNTQEESGRGHERPTQGA